MSGNQIVLTAEQLEKVLEGTGVSKRHFLAKLTNVKLEEHKENKLNEK